MLRSIAVIGTVLIITGCASAELRQARSTCTDIWMSKIPPIYEQEMYNKTQSRKVPTGYTSCSGYGNYITCTESMRTEYYTTTAVRTVDRNDYQRDPKIKSCTQKKCTQQLGNSKCES